MLAFDLFFWIHQHFGERKHVKFHGTLPKNYILNCFLWNYGPPVVLEEREAWCKVGILESHIISIFRPLYFILESCRATRHCQNSEKRETGERGNEHLAGTTGSVGQVHGINNEKLKRAFQQSTFGSLIIVVCKCIDTMLYIYSFKGNSGGTPGCGCSD